MNINIKRLHPEAKLPTYATDGSGCFDLYSLIAGAIRHDAVFRTGIAFEVPAGHVMLVFSRSGHGFKQNLRLANCVGVIDSDYRGELMVKLTNDRSEELQIIHGLDRIAQALVIPIPRVEFTEVDELSETGRGVGGFGSTGA